MSLQTYVVRHDHRRLEELMRHLRAVRHDLAAGMHPGVVSVAVSTAETFSQEVFRHMSREEREIYPLLDPDIADGLRSEHAEIQRLVSRMAEAGTAQSATALLADLELLDLQVHAHIRNEDAALASLDAAVLNRA